MGTNTRAWSRQVSRAGSNWGSARRWYPGTYSCTVRTMAWIDSTIRSCSSPGSPASGGMAQNTVLRIISGGSTGLRMMMALPRAAPPTACSAAAVVSVNSSMLARVPGPADFDAIDATISAYSTGTTLETAATMGTVAWPPQVMRLTFGASRLMSRFTGGQTYGPIAAGVRSIAVTPASA